MVCSYSFELSQKTVPTTFILNYRLICPYLEAIEKVRVFLFNAFLHQNILWNVDTLSNCLRKQYLQHLF